MSPIAHSNPAAAGKRLVDLLAGEIAVPADVFISDVAQDSRAVQPGGLFLACRGRTTHGLMHVSEAIANGARAVLWEPSADVVPPRFDASLFVAPVARLGARAGEIADRFFGQPSAALTIAGITGTNGKTTCAYLLAQALCAAGRATAYAGTLGVGFPDRLATATHTTADAVTLHRQLAALRALGAAAVAMEVSSHALDQQRVAGVRFHTAAFTNLTRDHLDYHGTMDAYGAAKARLFAWPGLAQRVINVDDAFGRTLAANAKGDIVVTTRRADTPLPEGARYVRAIRAQPSAHGMEVMIESSFGGGLVKAPLVGDFHVENLLIVLAVLLVWDLPFARAAAMLAGCSAPPGRMEAFGGGDRPLAIVDYAHTPDALAKALHAARAHCDGQLWVVFGCGGDRDAGKRPLMGAIATELADEVIVTDDNPRSERPEAIVADILSGIVPGRRVRTLHDRGAAIAAAIAAAGPGDVVLIAGKGHEAYQIHGTTRRVFSDQAEVRAALAERAAHARRAQ